MAKCEGLRLAEAHLAFLNSEIVKMKTPQLKRFLLAVNNLTTTNCWYVTYKFRQGLRETAVSELRGRGCKKIAERPADD